jgi:hypothetical protein
MTAPATSAPTSTQIEGVTITGADIGKLFAALKLALNPNDKTIPITIDVKSANDMPPYDKDWHYEGISQTTTGDKMMYAWVNADLHGEALQNALLAPILLAVADGGYAGPAFKELYDVYAAKDAQLPAGSPDPYLNRHKLAAALVHIVNSSSPSPNP